MTLKRIATLTAGAALFATSVFAQTQPAFVGAIVADLQAAGYTQIQVEARASRIQIEARNGMGSIERYYTLGGVLLREEVEENGVEIERVFDVNGNVISETIDGSGRGNEAEEEGEWEEEEEKEEESN